MSAKTLTAFFGGSALTGLLGYYSLHQDLFKVTKELDQHVLQVQEQVYRQNQDLAKRIQSLEQSLQKKE